MNDLILYNFATCGRPEYLKKCLDNLREMSAQKDNYVVLLKLDLVDPYFEENKAIAERYGEVVVWLNMQPGKINAINAGIQIIDRWDILVNLSDDILFTVPGFDDIIRKHSTGNRFLHFPCAYKQSSVSVVSIMGRTYYNRFGYVYHPSYHSLFCDNEATEVAKLLDRYEYVPIEIFKHDHYSTTNRPMDAVYKRNNTWREDKWNWQKRKLGNYGLESAAAPKLLIKYATRGRWRLFFEAINNIHATIQTNNFIVLVTADEDDVEMNCAEVVEFCKRFPNVHIMYGPKHSKINAINRDMPKDWFDWEWVVVMSDDMRFLKFGWDTAMLNDVHNVWRGGKDWFAHFNDGYVGDRCPTMHICDRAYYERDQFLYNPLYKSVSCDAEAMYVAQLRGRYHYFDNVYFHHVHPANLKMPSDRTYRENDFFGIEDTKVYFERLRRGFDVVDPVFMPDVVRQYMNDTANTGKLGGQN